MSGDFLFAVGSIGMSRCKGRKPSTLLQAARHNLRQLPAKQGEHSGIDPARTALNETLAGPEAPDDVVALAESLKAKAGALKRRQNECQAIEFVFSLPPATTFDTTEFFRCCVEWIAQRFGREKILSAVIHRDQSAPHCHVLVLPLVNNRMLGSELKSKKNIKTMREEFYREVGALYGLKKPTGRLRGEVLRQANSKLLQALEESQDGLLRSALLKPLLRLIELDPTPFMEHMNIEP